MKTFAGSIEIVYTCLITGGSPARAARLKEVLNMTLLIQGEIGVGKSTLIRALLDTQPGPLYGFLTHKEILEDGSQPVYIHNPQEKTRRYTPDNLVSVHQPGHVRVAYPEGFERAAEWLEEIPPDGGSVVLDELGVLEKDAPRFQAAVLSLLAPSPRLVIAAVKPADTPFLNRVRQTPGVRRFVIDRDNRDELRNRLLAMLGQPS